MCGIAGIISVPPVDRRLLARMPEILAHRGPDDCGLWTSDDAHVGFAHRGLAIVDLSPSERHSNAGLRLARYWSHRDAMRRGLADPIEDETETLAQLDSALGDAVSVDGRRACGRLPLRRDRQLIGRRPVPALFVDSGAHVPIGF